MLSLTEIDRSFGTTHAVKAVTLDAHPGSVLGLAGENGAGKSTLIKMVSGAIAPGGGRMILDGKPISPRDTNDAITHGISGVFQELTWWARSASSRTSSSPPPRPMSWA